MSTKRACVRACDETTAAATLPVDLLLEIAARSDAAAIVRCAAASKPLRGAILDPAFRRRLALRGFDPTLLRRVSYTLEERDVNRIARVVQTPLPSSDSEPVPVRSRLASLRLEPAAWRDGLVVFRRYSRIRSYSRDQYRLIKNISPGQYEDDEQLTVCSNIITGQALPLPPMAVRDHYPPALLTVDGNCFELLVADEDLTSQIYSSEDGKWSAARAAHHAMHPPPRSLLGSNKHPVIIGRTVHWLCVPGWCHNLAKADELQIVALDVDTAQATVIDLPQGCVSRMSGFKNNNAITLAVSAGGTRLSLVVSETRVMSMWSLWESTWSRRVLIDGPDWNVHKSVRFEGFGERSGTVLFDMSNVGLVQFNLATMEALVLLHTSGPKKNRISQVCLHEINLDSMLRAMKPFI
ncbi:hypothetical protein CFC21_067887 [Triticum aestivum]|uniref:DUF7595 domain-containing protein n=2 Tax=Triticum aestivum TaxID=4565 RepID=A0A3B6KNF0_WHEAT|nr:hypothetical protein CFC21_067887 [Triticum aestivum]